MRFLSIFVILAFLSFSCLSPDSDKNKEVVANGKNDVGALMADTLVGKTQNLSVDVLTDLLQTIPRPIEILEITEISGALYTPKLLNSTDNYKKYKDPFSQALNLGVYQADFVYLNIYNDKSSVLKFLDRVSIISNDLKLGEFFNQKVLSRVKQNIENTDSLLFIADQSYKKIHGYLKDRECTNVSALISYGAWIESMYLATQTAKYADKTLLYKRLGEQQVALDNIVFLVSVFSKDKRFESLLEDITNLRALYDNVPMTFNYAKPTIREENGVLTIIDNSVSEIKMTDDVFEKIKEQVARIRNKITR